MHGLLRIVTHISKNDVARPLQNQLPKSRKLTRHQERRRRSTLHLHSPHHHHQPTLKLKLNHTNPFLNKPKPQFRLLLHHSKQPYQPTLPSSPEQWTIPQAYGSLEQLGQPLTNWGIVLGWIIVCIMRVACRGVRAWRRTLGSRRICVRWI